MLVLACNGAIVFVLSKVGHWSYGGLPLTGTGWGLLLLCCMHHLTLLATRPCHSTFCISVALQFSSWHRFLTLSSSQLQIGKAFCILLSCQYDSLEPVYISVTNTEALWVLA